MRKKSVCCVICTISIGTLGLLGCSLDSASQTETQIGESFSSELAMLEAESTAPVGSSGQPEAAAPAEALAQAAAPASEAAPAPSGPSSGGFLWKPVSESNGNLVVLLPSQYRGRVSQTAILGVGGQVIEVGRFAGDTHNGNRPHYRFSMPGAGFGNNITVAARFTDGSVRTWRIPRGGSRFEA